MYSSVFRFTAGGFIRVNLYLSWFSTYGDCCTLFWFGTGFSYHKALQVVFLLNISSGIDRVSQACHFMHSL